MGKPQRVDLSNVVSLSDASKQAVDDHENSQDSIMVTLSDDHGDEAGDHNDPTASLSDDAVLTFRQLGDLLGEKPNTICASYWKRIAQAHEGLEAPSLRTDNGSPTGYFAKALAEYLKLGKDYDAYRTALEARFPATAQAPILPTVSLARYEPGASVTLAHQAVQRAEDRKFQALSNLADTLHEYNVHTRQMRQNSIQEVYEQEFTAELERLKREKELEMIRDQAREDARKWAQQQQEGNGS